MATKDLKILKKVKIMDFFEYFKIEILSWCWSSFYQEKSRSALVKLLNISLL